MATAPLKSPLGITLEIGQRWEELDGRFSFNRSVQIVDWDEKSQKVKIASLHRKTWAKLSRFNGKNGGYRFTGAVAWWADPSRGGRKDSGQVKI